MLCLRMSRPLAMALCSKTMPDEPRKRILGFLGSFYYWYFDLTRRMVK